MALFDFVKTTLSNLLDVPEVVTLTGLAKERYYLVKRIEGNEKMLEAELSNSASRGICCDWCGASQRAYQISEKLNRQYGRLAILDCKLGIPEDASYFRQWRAEMRKKHGHIEFSDEDQWYKPND